MEHSFEHIAQLYAIELINQGEGKMNLTILPKPDPSSGMQFRHKIDEKGIERFKKFVNENNTQRYFVIYAADIPMIYKTTGKTEIHKAVVMQSYSIDGKTTLTFKYFKVHKKFLSKTTIEWYDPKKTEDLDIDVKNMHKIHLGISMNVYK